MGPELKSAGKREANKHERRQAIVEIARQSFLDHGYAGTSMSAIATQLGGSKSTLWCYFPSKEELFAAVLDEATSAFRAQLVDVLAHQDSLAETVMAFCRSFITKLTSCEGSALHRLVVAETSRFPEVGQIFVARGPHPVRDMLTRYFAVQMAEGAMRRDDPERAAQTLTSLCLGGLHQRILWEGASATEAEIEAEAEAAATIFLRAFAA